MKFKSQDKQNKLIEKITVQHLVVGINIAYETQVARAVSSILYGLLLFSMPYRHNRLVKGGRA